MRVVLILDGELSLAEAFGFRRGNDKVRASSLTDVHNPKLRIVWGEELELPVLNCRNGLAFCQGALDGRSDDCRPKTRRRWVLWVAVPPGEHGYERSLI